MATALASQIADRLVKLANEIEDLEDEAQDAGVDLYRIESATDDLAEALSEVKEEIEAAGEPEEEEEEED